MSGRKLLKMSHFPRWVSTVISPKVTEMSENAIYINALALDVLISLQVEILKNIKLKTKEF